MYCNKTLQNKINAVHIRALRTVTRCFDCSFDELLSREGALSIHQRSWKVLLSEIYKSMYVTYQPEIVQSMFEMKVPSHNLRNSSLLHLPPTKSVRHGMNSFVFRGCQLWNSLQVSFKDTGSLNLFQKGLSPWVKHNCPCTLSDYIICMEKCTKCHCWWCWRAAVFTSQ